MCDAGGIRKPISPTAVLAPEMARRFRMTVDYGTESCASEIPGRLGNLQNSSRCASRVSLPAPDHRFARRHPAARASASVQNHRSPFAVSMRGFAYEYPPGTW